MIRTVQKHPIILIFLTLLLGTVIKSQIQNCQNYNQQQKYCEKCYYGYEINIKDNKCTAKTWIRVIGTLLSVRYLLPIFQVKSIFIDFIGQYWFFPVNSSQEIKIKQLTSIINALNQESLWPLGLKNSFQIIVGENSYNKYLQFMGIKKQLFTQKKKSIKQQLFLLDNHNFQFTTSCLMRIFQGAIILFLIYLALVVLDKILSRFTNFNLQQSHKIKGILIFLMTSKYYHFVSFYGFHQLQLFKGFWKFGQKLNILITFLTIFIFLFLSIVFHPLLYYFNTNENSNKKIKSQRVIVNKSHKKVHKILAFSYSVNGFFCYLLNGPVKQFIIGSLVGYFQESAFLYSVLALLYVIQYYLLVKIYKEFEQKPYFIFKKAFLTITIFYLLLLQEGMIHIFSDKSQSFGVLRLICLCSLFILGFLDTLTGNIYLILKFYKACLNLKQKNQCIQNPPSNSKRIIKIRTHGREPSIAQKLLRRLKQAKNSEIITVFQQKKQFPIYT